MSIDELRPVERRLVIDLVREAGVDVSDWANYGDGRKSPAANPKYCYEWAFGQAPSVIVLNVWHHELRSDDGQVLLAGNMRDVAAFETQSGTTLRRRRAEHFDEAVRRAWSETIPIRAIICSGHRRTRESLRASRVRKRLLDPEPWSVHAYDLASGHFVMRRGAAAPRTIDQFSLGVEESLTAEKRSTTGIVFVRQPDVRQAVLDRAAGKCELCEKPGFRLPDGSVYLETHHIIPLSEDGPDVVSNVVALCANHHREAHYGASRERMRKHLLANCDTRPNGEMNLSASGGCHHSPVDAMAVGKEGRAWKGRRLSQGRSADKGWRQSAQSEHRQQHQRRPFWRSHESERHP